MGKVTAEEMQGLMYGNSNNTTRSDGRSPKKVSASDMENLMAPYRSQEIKHTVLSPGTQPAQAAPAGASSRKQSDIMKEQLDAIKAQRDDALVKAGAYHRAGMTQEEEEQLGIASRIYTDSVNAETKYKTQKNIEATEDYDPSKNKFKSGTAALASLQDFGQSFMQGAGVLSHYMGGGEAAYRQAGTSAKNLMDKGVDPKEALETAGLVKKDAAPITDYKTVAELKREKDRASVGTLEGLGLDTAGTFAGMAVPAAASAIDPTHTAGLWLMAVSSLGHKYADAYEKYGNGDLAFALGLGAGAATYTTEQIGGVFGRLGGTKLGQAATKKLMSEAPGIYALATSTGGELLRVPLEEGLEEGAEDVVNYAIEKALTGESDEMDNIWYDMLLGALAGGVMGSANAATRAVNYNRLGKTIKKSPAAVQQQIEEGLSKGEGTAPAIYAAEAQKKPTSQMLGRLFEANQTFDAESGLSKIQGDITQLSIRELKAMMNNANAIVQAAETLGVKPTPESVMTEVFSKQEETAVKTAQDSVGQAFVQMVDNPANAGEVAYNSAIQGAPANQGTAQKVYNDPAARQAFSQLTGVQFTGNTAQDIAAIEVATQNIAKSGKQAISQAEYAQRVAAAGEQAAAQFDADMQAQAEQMQQESLDRWLSVEQNTITDVDGKRRIKEITNTDVRGNTEIGYKKAEILGSKKKAVAEVNNAAKYLGKTIVWFEGAVQVNGQYRLTNGYRAPDGTIYVNINSRDPLMVTFGHEMFHDLVADSKYSGLIDTLVENPDYADMVNGMMNAKTELYERNGIELDPNAAAEEVAADISGDLLGNRDMLEYIGARNTEAATGIKGFLNRILKKLKGKPSAQEAYNRLSESQRALIDGMEDGARNIFADPAIGEDVKYSIREEAPPEKTILGYKVFVVKDGKLYPPMVANPNAEDTPVGVWLNADIGERAPDSKTGRMQVKAGGKGTQGGSGSLAFRPGWHLGEVPVASQFDRLNPETGKKELFPSNFVWAECLVAADIDYQEEAMSYGYTKSGKFQHSLAGLPKLPVDGYYKYRTNPRPDTVPWLITGAMKVNRILSDSDVAQILESKGITPPKRQGGEKTLEQLGLGKYADGKFSLIGVFNDGLEIYETSLATQQLSESQKKKQYLALIKNQYRGRTARLERNGHVVYVRPDIQEAGKPIYGDRRSTANGAKALRNSLADGDVFDLLENAEYDRSSRDTKNHKNADYFDYYVKTVQIDGKVYDLVADVKRAYGNSDGLYYTLHLVDNATKKAVVSQRPQTLGSSEPITASEMGSNSFSADMVPQSDTAVNNYSMQNSVEDAGGSYSLMDDHRGNGYDGYSMSNNARAAYESGEKPLSNWTKTDIIDAIQDINPDIDCSRLNAATLKKEFLTQTSWHHTSKFYNRTNFYSIDTEYVEGLTQSEVDAIKNVTEPKKVRNASVDASVDDAYSKIQTIVEAGFAKNEDSAVKKLLRGDSLDAAYREAVDTIRERDAKKVDAWRKLPEDHWRKKYVSLYDSDIESYIKEMYAANKLSKNSKLFKSLEEHFNDGGKFSLMDIPAMDNEYSAAVESGNMQEAQRLVNEAAKAAGYNSEPLYHGTKSFGFTKIDTAQADDKMSFFATSNPDMAQTYSGKKGNKAINNAAGNTRAMPIEDVVNRLNEESSNDGYEDGSSYRIMKRADVKSFLADLDRRIESLNDVIARKVDEYADRLAEDFSQNNITAHDTLVRLLEATENYRYSGMSTPLWMLSKHTDVFNESEKKLAGEIEADVRLRNRLEARGGSDDVVVREDLDRYSISVMSFAEAREELAKLSASGNYSLRGRTDNFLDVDGNNHNWNEIFTTLEPKGGNNFLAEYNQDTGSVIMSDKDGRFAEVHASTLSDALPGMARAITKKFGSYFAPQILSSAKDQLRNGATAEVAVKSTGKMSTRDIAKFAKEQGYRGVKISNIYDNGGGGKDAGAGDVYIFFYPEEDVKSADPVTYDDAGNVIPLSERFNNSNSDIRYSLMEDAQYMADIDRVVSEATEKANDELKAAQAEVKDIRQQLADYRQQATAEAKNTAAWKDGEAKLIAGLSEAQSKEKKARALASYMDEYNAISERYRGEVRATDTEALAQYNEKLSNLRSGFRGEMENLAIEQGAFKRGEKAARDIYVPTSVNGKKVTRGTRTILEASQTPESMLEEHAKEILAGARGYEVISDKKAQEYAERIIDKEGYDKADELFTNAVNGDQVLDKKTLVLGEYLYMEAAKAGDVKNAMRYAADVAAAATRAGQVVQAMRVLKKATPTGKLYYLNRMVDTMNKNIVDNGGDPIQIDEGLARKLLEAENIKDPKEQGKAVDETIDEIEQNIADQIPVTAWDKWNAWRYLSMLGNIRTQVRNVVGNAAFMPLVATKNLLAAGMEKAFIRNGGRTKSAFFTKTNVGKRLMEFGKKDFDTVVDEIQGGGKYNQSSSIEEKRTIFKSKAIEGWRKLTNKAMDKGDEIFSKHHYARALAGYLYANHLDYDKITRNTPQAQEVLNKARAYAILEAQKATFRDANQFAAFINKTKRNLLKKAQTAETKGAKAGWYVGTAVAEGIMPFTKTPIDILSRGVEYSPIGLIKGIKEAVYDVKKGNKTAAEAIDTLSAGLTGTGIFALGYFLQSLGLLAGALDDDKESKYKKDRGAQGFAIHIGDKYYTIDWLAPFSLPLFTGAAVAETVENGDEVSFATLADVFSTISEPMLEMSMLQGVNSALSNGQYSSDSKIVSFMTNQITGYLSQANPTILGQIARAVDDTSRNAYYYDPNYKGFVQTGKVFGDKQIAKVPFASKALTSRVDLWGNKQENTGGSFFGRLAYNMLSPGYYSEESSDPVDVALTKLYEETEDTAVLPSKPKKSFKNNKTTYKMNAKQYEEFCIVEGQTAHKEIQTFINSAEYKKMSNEDRVGVLDRLYTYSAYKAQKNLLGDKYVTPPTYGPYVKAEAYAKGGNPVYKYFLKD